MRGGPARTGGSDETAGWGTVAGVAAAPEAAGRAAAGPPGGPVAVEYLEGAAGLGPLRAAPSRGLQKERGAGAPPGAWGAAVGPEDRGL